MKAFRPTLGLIFGTTVLVAPACVVGSNDDDDDSDTSLSSTTGSTTSTTAPSGDCINILQDPGFEQGTPNPYWQVTSSVLQTPICDNNCSNEAPARPHGGTWWVWFGGVGEPDTASVSQQLVFSTNVTELHFFYQAWAGTQTGDDTLTVSIDGETVYTLSDSQRFDHSTYVQATVDVSRFADGAAHTLTFHASTSGVGDPSFFIDDVALYDCGGVAPGTSTGTGTSTTGEDDTTEGSSSTGEPEGDASSSTSAEESSSGGASTGESAEESTSGGEGEASSSGDASTGDPGGEESSGGAESSSGAGEESSGSTGA